MGRKWLKWYGWIGLCVLIAGCNGKRTTSDEPMVGQDSMMVTRVDSTLYGVAGEHGMSTFCLITDEGDTLLMSRTSEEGVYGVFYGDVREGDRYAVMACDDNESLSEAINLTQLNRFVHQYTISNGKLVLIGHERSDTVRMSSMNRDSLVVVYQGGQSRIFTPLN